MLQNLVPVDARGRTGLSPAARRHLPRDRCRVDDDVTTRSLPRDAVRVERPSKRATSWRGMNCIAGPLALPAVSPRGAFRCQASMPQTRLLEHAG